MNGMKRYAGRVIFQMVLFTIFIVYFGLPAYKRYEEKEVMVVRSRRPTGGIRAPAITISARNPQTTLGFRGNTSQDVLELCSNETIIDNCISKHTYNQSEVVNDILLGFVTKEQACKPRIVYDSFLWEKYGFREACFF